jgi:hypothetical protein
VNQAAISKIHMKGHAGAHFELEERARRIFSDSALELSERARMAAAFAVAFVTPVMAGSLFDNDFGTDLSSIVAQIVRDILRPGRKMA